MGLVQVQAPLALATIIALLAQQPPQPVQNPPTTFKSATRLVQVNVIAQDGKGQPVTDLKKEDFRVRVNGKDQPVKTFSVDSNIALPSSDPQKGDQLPPNVFSNRTAVAPGQKSSITIILLDYRNTSLPDQAYAKAQVIRYLRTLHPGDHIGLYVFGQGLRILHDYTADSTELLSRLEALKYKALPNMSSKEPHAEALRNDSLIFDDMMNGMGVPGGVSSVGGPGIGGAGTSELSATDNRYIATIRAIRFIANHLTQTPGRKNLIWVSAGFPLHIPNNSLVSDLIPKELNETVRALNDANVAVYSVDARGLVSDQGYDAAAGGRPSRGGGGRPIGIANQDSMFELASRSGGRAYVNTNDLTKAIHDAVDDSRFTYTLGFYPVDETFDGKFHKIEVDLIERKGVHLRYRKGFVDLPEVPQDEKTRKRELSDAARSPLEATGVGLTAKVVLSKTKPGALDVVLAIDTTQISLQNQSENWVGRLDVLFVQGEENGKQYNAFGDTINLRFSSATYAKFLKEGFVYTRQVGHSDPAQHLRIIVRDAATGAMGSVTVPLAKVF